jgi:hypothetical protein
MMPRTSYSRRILGWNLWLGMEVVCLDASGDMVGPIGLSLLEKYGKGT